MLFFVIHCRQAGFMVTRSKARITSINCGGFIRVMKPCTDCKPPNVPLQRQAVPSRPASAVTCSVTANQYDLTRPQTNSPLMVHACNRLRRSSAAPCLARLCASFTTICATSCHGMAAFNFRVPLLVGLSTPDGGGRWRARRVADGGGDGGGRRCHIGVFVWLSAAATSPGDVLLPGHRTNYRRSSVEPPPP